MLSTIRKRDLVESGPEQALDLEVNALICANAEKYYRTMMTNDNESWNIRDRHMVEVLTKLMSFYGNEKVIVWEHNTHIGDARATDMVNEGLVNVGQLIREHFHEDNTYIVGFGTYRGQVIAADQWGAPLKVMTIPPAREGSWEEMVHRMEAKDQIIMFNQQINSLYDNPINHRAIGVVYNPDFEQFNYVPSIFTQKV